LSSDQVKNAARLRSSSGRGQIAAKGRRNKSAHLEQRLKPLSKGERLDGEVKKAAGNGCRPPRTKNRGDLVGEKRGPRKRSKVVWKEEKERTQGGNGFSTRKTPEVDRGLCSGGEGNKTTATSGGCSRNTPETKGGRQVTSLLADSFLRQGWSSKNQSEEVMDQRCIHKQ